MASKKRASTLRVDKTSTTNGVRGATMGKVVTGAITAGKKFEVAWNADGQPIGPHSSELRSYIGTSAKRLVPITYSDWRLVPETLKELVWKEVLTGFVIPEGRKTWVLKVANTLWKKFKSYLTKTRIYDENGEICPNPPAIYTQYITQEAWDKFIAIRQTKEFEESSEAHRELSLKNMYSYRGSRTGYAEIAEKMKEERGTSEVPRSDVWNRAREQKDGQFSPNVQDVADKMEHLSQQAAKGEIVVSRRKDILSLALGKDEHPGRARGVGQYVTITEYVQHASRSTSSSRDASAVAIKNIEERMEEKLKAM